MISSQIQSNLPHLTPAERNITAFLLRSPQRVTAMTVHPVAEPCGTASSAVTRFCKSIRLRDLRNGS